MTVNKEAIDRLGDAIAADPGAQPAIREPRRRCGRLRRKSWSHTDPITKTYVFTPSGVTLTDDKGHAKFVSTQDVSGLLRTRAAAIRALALPPSAAPPNKPYQARVHDWIVACFGQEIGADKAERSHRLLEEALELVQSGGCTAGEAHQLVDYVFSRPVGDMHQEVGGVMITLAAFCTLRDIDMIQAGEVELTRVWSMAEKIRAKQAAKPKHSPLPVAASSGEPAGWRDIELEDWQFQPEADSPGLFLQCKSGNRTRTHHERAQLRAAHHPTSLRGAGRNSMTATAYFERAHISIGEVNDLRARIAELEGLINKPTTDDWFAGVPMEAAHQVERWAASHDAGKAPLHSFWLIG